MTFYLVIASIETGGANVKPGVWVLLTFIHIHYQEIPDNLNLNMEA